MTTNGTDFGASQYLLRANGSGGWEWVDVPGIFSVDNILNGFTVTDEGSVVGSAGSIKQLDFRGSNIIASADPGPNGIATVRVSDTPTFNSLVVTGITTLGLTTSTSLFSNELSVSGVSTFVGVGTFQDDLYVGGNLYVQNDLVFDEFTARNINVTGISTLVHLDVTDVNASGIITATGGFVGDLTGIAATATDAVQLQTARDFSVSGDVATASSVSFDGTGNVDLAVTLSNTFSANTTGIITAYRFSGILDGYATTAGIATYATTAGIATVAQGLTGTPNITVGIITAVDASFSGNVSIAGTLTYEDVTNIDAIGVVTARSDVLVGGNLSVVGITTLASAGGITTTGGDLYVDNDLYFNGDLFQNGSLFTSGIGIGLTSINPQSGLIVPEGRVGIGFTDINFVGTGITITGYGSTVVVDFNNFINTTEFSNSNLVGVSTLGFFGDDQNITSSVTLPTNTLLYTVHKNINVAVGNTLTVGSGTTIIMDRLNNLDDVVATSFKGDGSQLTGIPVGDLYELDQISPAGGENTYTPTFNYETVAVSNPFRLLISVDGIMQSAYVYNTEYVFNNSLLVSRSGYTIDYDGNIKFTEALPEGSEVMIKTTAGTTKSTTRRYPFNALDILF